MMGCGELRVTRLTVREQLNASDDNFETSFTGVNLLFVVSTHDCAKLFERYV